MFCAELLPAFFFGNNCNKNYGQKDVLGGKKSNPELHVRRTIIL